MPSQEVNGHVNGHSSGKGGHEAKPHPLDPLSPQEISKVAQFVRESHTGTKIIFRVISLLEPPKVLLLPFLEAEHNGVSAEAPPRKALVQYYLNVPDKFREAHVDVQSGEETNEQDLVGKQSYTDGVEGQESEQACLADERVQKEIKSLDLPEDAVVCIEPWTYGTDGMHDMSHRVIMCYFYMRMGNHGDANHFAYPLDLCAEMSSDKKIIGVFRLPSRMDEKMEEAGPGNKKYDRRKIHSTSEYHPDLQTERRTTTKPLQVVQPEGPSFNITGNLIEWEKYRFRVGFNYREGLTIHDVQYEGRSLFYRLSLSEMFVPYADARAPYPRKAAFDLGNNGAGLNANNLQLGCDCLGVIKYFDGWHHTTAGDPVKLPNAVCCHEIDDGILWKHTNYRTSNAVVTRSRVLVLQTIITVGNYEYIFAFHFGQDASVNYEVRATGILSTSPIDIGDKVSYGTIVAPGVMAPYHQHLFSLRIDPAIGGPKNTLFVEESHPMSPSDPLNPFAIGYTTTQTPVTHETHLDTSHETNRVFKIVNESHINPISGTPVSYKLVPHYSQMLLAHPSSYHAKRSEFTTHALWVTKYHDYELYASGNHTMQSLGGEGIASWIQNRTSPTTGKAEEIQNEDIVLWHTFGTTHNPRVEDWPVMPSEKMSVGLKPVNFFTGNPGMDVGVSNQKINRSVLYEDKVKSVGMNGETKEGKKLDGEGCCA